MADTASARSIIFIMSISGVVRHHLNILGALVMREIVTRYGREGIGFLWLVVEPLLFCFGVMGLWTLIKPEYEHGIRVAPFVMTGYMCLLLFRHIIGQSAGALQANVGLLHHKSVRPLHIYVSRSIMETAGGTLAFVVVYITLLMLGAVSPPSDVILLYSGWLILSGLATGIAIIFASLAIRFEVMERILPVFLYVQIPLSGAFVMVDWVPVRYQSLYLLNPLPHTVEMVRASVFGEFVQTHYSVGYSGLWAVGLIFVGLLILSQTQKYLEVE